MARTHLAFHDGHESPGDSSFIGKRTRWKTCGFAEPPGKDETWIQYPGQPGINGQVPVWMRLITGERYGDCFHPNELGAIAIADAVNFAAELLGR
jgi:hypothetical protein